MELTPNNKTYIDGLSIYNLLHKVRFAPVGDPWMEGETGEYWLKRLSDLRNKEGGNAIYVAASKVMGHG